MQDHRFQYTDKCRWQICIQNALSCNGSVPEHLREAVYAEKTSPTVVFVRFIFEIV